MISLHGKSIKLFFTRGTIQINKKPGGAFKKHSSGTQPLSFLDAKEPEGPASALQVSEDYFTGAEDPEDIFAAAQEGTLEMSLPLAKPNLALLKKYSSPYTNKATTFIIVTNDAQEIAYDLASPIPLSHGHIVEIIEMQVGSNPKKIVAVYNHNTKDCCFIGNYAYRTKESGLLNKPMYGLVLFFVFSLSFLCLLLQTELPALFIAGALSALVVGSMWLIRAMYIPHIDNVLRGKVEEVISGRFGVAVNTLYYYT